MYPHFIPKKLNDKKPILEKIFRILYSESLVRDMIDRQR